MHESLKGKKILIAKGSLIANEELQEALAQEGARPFLAHNVSHAFDLVERIRFDQAFDIPYIFCSAPHRLQGWQARKRDAEHAVCKLAHVLRGSTGSRQRSFTAKHCRVV